MGTVEAVLAQARSELGYTESPPRSNRQKFAAEAGHANGQRWCATFIVAMMRRCGVHLPSESAFTPTMADGFRRAGLWSGTPVPGDVVFFEFPDAGRICHVALVERVGGGGVHTIEGNTDSGGSANGGAVMRKHRTRHIVGYGRPDYGPPKVEEETQEEPDMQIIANYKPDQSLHYFYVADGGDLYHAWWPRVKPLGRKAEQLAAGSKFDGQPSVTVDPDDTIHIVCDRPGAEPPAHVFRIHGANPAWVLD